VHKLLLDLPVRFESERCYLRCYQAGDGPMLFAVSQRNHTHLMQFESDNVVMEIHNLEDAEVIARDLAANWVARRCFFLGVFDKRNDEFVAQVYIGPVNWDLPEFDIGYFADVDHEGQGYVTEAVRRVVQFIFESMKAQRVSLECSDSNVRSARVAERCGMTKEGTFRQNRKELDGTFSGTLHYAILRSEYEPAADT
jgi:RimJ/RimL family protein N-acetyltransferase